MESQLSLVSSETTTVRLYRVLKQGRTDAVQAILEEDGVHHENEKGQTAIVTAVLERQLTIAAQLEKKGADINRSNSSHLHPVEAAIIANQYDDAVKLLAYSKTRYVPANILARKNFIFWLMENPTYYPLIIKIYKNTDLETQFIQLICEFIQRGHETSPQIYKLFMPHIRSYETTEAMLQYAESFYHHEINQASLEDAEIDISPIQRLHRLKNHFNDLFNRTYTILNRFDDTQRKFYAKLTGSIAALGFITSFILPDESTPSPAKLTLQIAGAIVVVFSMIYLAIKKCSPADIQVRAQRLTAEETEHLNRLGLEINNPSLVTNLRQKVIEYGRWKNFVGDIIKSYKSLQSTPSDIFVEEMKDLATPRTQIQQRLMISSSPESSRSSSAASSPRSVRSQSS